MFYCIGAIKPDVYGSQLSLGEIVHDAGIHPRFSASFDGISPISVQNMCNSDSKLVRETKKLIRAVKKEDAYGIVCALKRGASPCLLINDVSALHLAAGLKSDQRCSIVSIDGFHSPSILKISTPLTTLFHALLWVLIPPPPIPF